MEAGTLCCPFWINSNTKGQTGSMYALFEVLGHYLDFQTAKYEDGRLPLKAVRTIVRQLLLGLDFLHRECGIIHTGMAMRYQSPPTQNHGANYHRHPDLKPTNILLELETPEETIEKYLTETTPRITTEGGTTKPLREVITTPLISEMRDLHIRIVDFGVGTYHLSYHLPALRAPEVTIGAHWDAKVDIWSLGCLVSTDSKYG